MTSASSILLTGGTGYLGSNLLRHLVRGGHHVTLLKRSFSNCTRIAEYVPFVKSYDLNVTSLEQIFGENQFDCVLHCATNYGRREESAGNIIAANLLLPLQLLELSVSHKVKTFINTDTLLDKRVSAYSLSKRQFVSWLEHFSTGLSCINVALEHFYGPFDDDSKFASHIVHSLIKNVETIDLTLGEQKRDFVYIDDVVAAFIKIIEFSASASKGFHSFEVGSGTLIRIRDFAELARTISGNTKTVLNFGALPYRTNEVMVSKVDISSLAALGWQAQVSVREGLIRTFAAERELQNRCGI